MKRQFTVFYISIWIIGVIMSVLSGCSNDKSTDSKSRTVPHEGKWGIYSLDLSTGDVSLIYSTDSMINNLNLSNSGTLLALSIKTQELVDLDTTSEIFILDLSTQNLTRLTSNYVFDSYPSFSPDDSKLAFLSLRGVTLDLFTMDIDGSNQQLLYNSGGHDGDVDWGTAGKIAFTRDYQIWSVDSNGTDPRQVTDPPDAGVWGNANLPKGDYDPRFNPDGSKIAFERMVDVSFIHGGYDIVVSTADGMAETTLTSTGSLGYAQGFANWSHSGDKIVYLITAIETEGIFDIYMMNADGSGNHKITPDYFPALFLCHQAIFSHDDAKIYFIGQWWE